MRRWHSSLRSGRRLCWLSWDELASEGELNDERQHLPQPDFTGKSVLSRQHRQK
jgi:hypothetical protein